MTQPGTVIGAFESPQQAEKTIEELRHGGFSHDQIGFVIRHGEGTEVVVGGGLLGALIGLGIPEEDARYYERVFQEGEALVIVRATDRSAEASAILELNGAQEMKRSSPT